MKETIPGLERSPWFKVAFGVALVVALVVGFVVVRTLTEPPPAPAKVNKWTEAEINAARRPTYAEQVVALPDAAAAVAFFRHRFRSVSGPNPDPTAEAFAMWAAHKLSWDQIGALKPTSHARAMKDPAVEAGNYLCATLRVIQIRADRDFGPVVYRGLLAYDAGGMVSFVAVGSTGDIVAGREAHFCGVVTGTWEFPNISNQWTQSVHVVGMFNLPENRPALAQKGNRP